MIRKARRVDLRRCFSLSTRHCGGFEWNRRLQVSVASVSVNAHTRGGIRRLPGEPAARFLLEIVAVFGMTLVEVRFPDGVPIELPWRT